MMQPLDSKRSRCGSATDDHLVGSWCDDRSDHHRAELEEEFDEEDAQEVMSAAERRARWDYDELAVQRDSLKLQYKNLEEHSSKLFKTIMVLGLVFVFVAMFVVGQSCKASRQHTLCSAACGGEKFVLGCQAGESKAVCETDDPDKPRVARWVDP